VVSAPPPESPVVSAPPPEPSAASANASPTVLPRVESFAVSPGRRTSPGAQHTFAASERVSVNPSRGKVDHDTFPQDMEPPAPEVTPATGQPTSMLY
jgi:hypothetical protein